jgi:hypothetical protein
VRSTRLKIVLLIMLVVLPVISLGVYWVAGALSGSPVARYYEPIQQQLRGKSGGSFRLVYVVTRGGSRLAEYGDLAPGATTTSDGAVIPFALSAQMSKAGAIRLDAPLKHYKADQINPYLERMLTRTRNEPSQAVQWTMAIVSQAGMVGVLVLLVWAFKGKAKPKELQVRGPVLVGGEQFNGSLGQAARGIGFLNLNQGRRDGQRVYIPRGMESSHFLIVGDSGTGKSALIRQMLLQIAERNEAAIIYDPALEYTRQFYTPERGDIILNPLDERMPYWSPGAEVRNEAETTTLAASMFPDKPQENRFFTEAPRKVFARLLAFRPSPEELTRWMSNEKELEAKLSGTELMPLIHPQAGPQRAGVISSLNMVADSLKMLPRKEETRGTWTALEWMQERKGWIFLTSIPELRERLLPLTSFWLDTLVLRSMNQGRPGIKPVWFVLDELASLQRLPQLHTAVTENRKSGNPVVLGFQGKSQLETRYGHDAEAMLSQPATKLFLRTSEPRAAEWISKTIGEVETERQRESVTKVSLLRKTRTTSWDRRREPLVMASQIGGLPSLNGYLKTGNLAVPIRFPYLELANKAEGYIERAQASTLPLSQPETATPVSELEQAKAVAANEPGPQEQERPLFE